jgi:integrase
MKINLNLRDAQTKLEKEPSKQKETPINLVIRWSNQRIVHSTGKSIHPKFWSLKDQRAKAKYEVSSELNEQLSNQKNKIENAFNKYQNQYNRIPNAKQFKEYIIQSIDKANAPEEEKKVLNFYELINYKIELERKRLLNEGKNPNRSIVSHYERLSDLLHQFEKETSFQVNFEIISIVWYNEFVQFLNKQKFSPNTKGRIIKNIKTIMNLANEKGLTNNQNHKNKLFKKIQEQTFHVYLNEEEIQALYEFECSEERLSKVKDLFVIACRTGLRVSDLKRINKDHIFTTSFNVNEDNSTIEIQKDFIRITTQKTNKEVDVPLHPNVSEILKNYEFNLPKITDQKFNEYIKEVCQLAGINDPCTYHQTKGGLKVRLEKPKYELISSHTGRRSWATNHYKEGFPILSIMAITGHSTVKDFKNYVVLDANEHAKTIAKHYYKLEEEKRASKQHLKLA